MPFFFVTSRLVRGLDDRCASWCLEDHRQTPVRIARLPKPEPSGNKNTPTGSAIGKNYSAALRSSFNGQVVVP
jgi:hypothetical protein